MKFLDVVSQGLHVDTLCSQAQPLIADLFHRVIDLLVVRVQNDDGQLPAAVAGLSQRLFDGRRSIGNLFLLQCRTNDEPFSFQQLKRREKNFSEERDALGPRAVVGRMR